MEKKSLKKKSHSAEKNLKGGPFGLVRHCMLRGKPFWLSSLGQQVQFGVFSKFCRNFGRTILVTSGGLKKTLTKSHDYSRLFSGNAPTENSDEIEEGTSRDRPNSASRNNHWKNLRNIFFQNKVFGKKVAYAEKPKKRPFRLIKRSLQSENFKKFEGVPFDRIQKFSEKCRIVPKKPQRGTPWSPLYFWKHKKICGLVRDSNSRFPASPTPENQG